MTLCKVDRTSDGVRRVIGRTPLGGRSGTGPLLSLPIVKAEGGDTLVGALRFCWRGHGPCRTVDPGRRDMLTEDTDGEDRELIVGVRWYNTRSVPCLARTFLPRRNLLRNPTLHVTKVPRILGSCGHSLDVLGDVIKGKIVAGTSLPLLRGVSSTGR